MGSNGALLSSEESRSRWLETQVRVGSYDLDNTHKVGNSQPTQGSYGTAVPVDNAPEVLRRAMWMRDGQAIPSRLGSADQDQYEQGSAGANGRGTRARIFRAKSRTRSMARKFPFIPTANPGKKRFAFTRARFRASPQILNSIVTFSATGDNQYQVTSEGTRLQFGQIHYRLELFIQGKAPDGMDIDRYYNFDWTNPADAPDDKTVLAEGQVLRKELEALVAAPLVEPYAGPALLTGRATAVFFHEVFRPSRRGLPPEGHQRRTDLRPQSRRADSSEFPFHLRRPDGKNTRQGHAARLLPVRR